MSCSPIATTRCCSCCLKWVCLAPCGWQAVLALVFACFKYAKRPESFFILALASITVCQLVEYPLWYVYFLMPFALFWALVPRREAQQEACGKLNWAAMLTTVVALAVCVRLLFAYNDIMGVYGVAKNESVEVAASKIRYMR